MPKVVTNETSIIGIIICHIANEAKQSHLFAYDSIGDAELQGQLPSGRLLTGTEGVSGRETLSAG